MTAVTALLTVLGACANRGTPPAAGSPGAPATAPAAAVVSAPALEEQPGTIRRVGSFGFGIVPDRDPGTRYAPDRLPKELEVDGLRVIFTGTETTPPEGVRQWGTPLHVVSIRRADR